MALLAPASADTTAERLWLADLLEAETMVLAAVETADVGELSRQSLALMRLMGKANEVLSRLGDLDRMNCVMTATHLYGYVASLRIPEPARALVSARADAALYRKTLPRCGQALGVKAKSKLPS